MYPTLVTIGNWPISTFGLFLGLAVCLATFIIWRISRLYDINEEQTIDLILVTFAGGFLFSRIYFALFHLDYINTFWKFLFVFYYPGLSFWGGLAGGILTLWLLTRRHRFSFWEIADFATVGFFLALAVGSFGCFFGGCQPGLPSNLPIAVKMAGLLDKRFPLQVVEGLIYLVVFSWLWKTVLRFHFTGKIFALGLLFLGVIKLGLEFFRADQQELTSQLSIGHLFAVALLIAGLRIYYLQGKRLVGDDLMLFWRFFTHGRTRQLVMSKQSKRWYNFRVETGLAVSNGWKNLLKRLNIKSTPSRFRV